MGILECFKYNFKPIMKLGSKIAGTLFTVACIVLTFVTFDDMGINDIGIKILILFIIVLVSFMSSFIFIMLILKQKKIWKKGNNSVTALYGDLMNIAFDYKGKEKRIVVIPVNDAFDTIVEGPSEEIPFPLVQPSSVHGMWVTRFLKTEGLTIEELDKRINLSLNSLGYENPKSLTKELKKRGKLDSYSEGTIAVIEGSNNVVYYLLALSTFDKENRASTTKRKIRDSFEKLLEFYDKKGQGVEMYLPLMGTGKSRTGMDHKEAFNVLKGSVLASSSSINGKINIVVYKKDKEKVSIFN